MVYSLLPRLSVPTNSFSKSINNEGSAITVFAFGAGTVIAEVASARYESPSGHRRREMESEMFTATKLKVQRLVSKPHSKLRRLKLRRLKLRRLERKTHMTNRVAKTFTSLLILLALAASTVLPALGQTRRRPALRRRAPARRVVKTVAPVYYNVNAGQVIRVRMNQNITSETAHVGDQFSTTVVEPVYAGGVEVIPAGSTITGRVATVTRASRKSRAGTLGVHFVALRLPTGIARTINGDLTDATASNVNADNEGEISGRSATKRNVVFIGGGAATGAAPPASGFQAGDAPQSGHRARPRTVERVIGGPSSKPPAGDWIDGYHYRIRGQEGTA
jgi:hypothetical protein